MQIIPAINCPDFECVKEKLQKAAGFLPTGGWVQLDIADGKFTPHKTWNEPAELKIENLKLKINFEIHLMVENPEKVIDDWMKAGVKRIIIHLEAIDAREFSRIWPQISRMAEIGLAISPKTSVEKLIPYISGNQLDISVNQRSIKFIQILAVNPGSSGQKFQPAVLEKIKFLKKKYPDVIIEVDGGINLEAAKLCKEAGADILVAGSYIWDNADPKKAYLELTNI